MKMVKTLYCPTCQKPIGDIYIKAGKVYCFVGDCLVRVLIHNCPICGRSFHWHADEIERQAKKKPMTSNVMG